MSLPEEGEQAAPIPAGQPDSRVDIQNKVKDEGSAAALNTYQKFTRQLTRLHAHPITVHIPNGVLPLSVLFLVIAFLLDKPDFGIASAYNMIVVFLAMPVVIYSGVVDWQNRYGGHLTSIFMTKIICAAIVLTASLALSIWWLVDPGIVESAAARKWVFLFFHIFILAPAVLAGFLGGKLVFPNEDN